MPKKLDKSVSDLIETLDPNLRAQAASYISTLTPESALSFSSLLALVDSQEATVDIRRAGCWFLGHLGDKSALRPLLGRVKSDSDVGVVWEAAKALVNLGNTKAVPNLIVCLAEEAQPERRSAIVWALGNFYDKRAVPVLIQTLQNKLETPQVRGHTAEALGQLRDKRVLKVLVAALKDEFPEVRFWSAYALGQLKDPSVISELEQLAKSDKAVVPGWWAVKKEARAAIDLLLPMGKLPRPKRRASRAT
jgi:HEAT repeat protein